MAGFELTLYGRIWVTPKDGTGRQSVYQHHGQACEDTL